MKTQALSIASQQLVDLQDCILLGKLVGVWGVKGWLKVFSYTRPRKDIGNYKHWLLVSASAQKKHSNNKSAKISVQRVDIRHCREQGKSIVAQIDGVNDPDQGKAFFGYEIYIEKSQLKPLPKGEVYWSDMIGCDVANKEGDVLGVVDSMLETGANDVLIVHKIQQKIDVPDEIIEHLIPYSAEIVLSVDAKQKKILVDWGVDYLVAEKNTQAKQSKLTNTEVN